MNLIPNEVESCSSEIGKQSYNLISFPITYLHHINRLIPLMSLKKI